MCFKKMLSIKILTFLLFGLSCQHSYGKNKIIFSDTMLCLSSSYTPGLSSLAKALESNSAFDSSTQSRKLIIPGELISNYMPEYDDAKQISGLAHNILNVKNTSDSGKFCAKTAGLCKESVVYKDIFYSYWLHISQIDSRDNVKSAIKSVFSEWEIACKDHD